MPNYIFLALHYCIKQQEQHVDNNTYNHKNEKCC